MSQHSKQIPGRRIPVRPEHPHQISGGRNRRRLFQLPETHRRVDIVPGRTSPGLVFSSPESISSIASRSSAWRNFSAPRCARSHVSSPENPSVSAIAYALDNNIYVTIDKGLSTQPRATSRGGPSPQMFRPPQAVPAAGAKLFFMEWSACPAVDRNPAKLGGKWCFRDIALCLSPHSSNISTVGAPPSTNSSNGSPAVNRDQVHQVLAFAKSSLEQPAAVAWKILFDANTPRAPRPNFCPTTTWCAPINWDGRDWKTETCWMPPKKLQTSICCSPAIRNVRYQ